MTDYIEDELLSNPVPPMARPTDDQDRVLVEFLTQDEKLTEIVNYMRGFTDLMTQLAEQPMIGKVLGLPTTMFKHSHSKL